MTNKNDRSVSERSKGDWGMGRRMLTIGIVFLALSLFGQFLCGILYGLAHDWMRMCLYFFGSFLAILFCCMMVLREALGGLFRHLVTRSGEKHRVPQPMPRWARVADIVATVSVPLQIVLAILAGLHDRWLTFGLWLLGCGVVIVVSFSMGAGFKIRHWSNYLRERDS